jgi:hypothetical protein
MPRYRLVVLSRPKDGRDAEYNDWYSNIHLDDVVRLHGVKSAQRFRATTSMSSHEPPPYLAIYEIETDDIGAFMTEITSKSGTEELLISDALDDDPFAVVYEEMGPMVTR